MDLFQRVLIIETSSTIGRIALGKDENIIVSRELLETRRHARDLAALAKEMFEEAHWVVNEISAVIVGIGPGSFTGLRVGIASAKALAYAIGCPLYGVPTFDMLAAQVSGRTPNLGIIADALQGFFYVRKYHFEPKQGWRPSEPLSIQRFDEWLATFPEAMRVTGPALDLIRTRLPQDVMASPEGSSPQPTALLRLVRERSAEYLSNAWELEPIYLRGSSAEEKRRKEGMATSPLPAGDIAPPSG